jgi:hypothetical protein
MNFKSLIIYDGMQAGKAAPNSNTLSKNAIKETLKRHRPF